MKLERCDDPRRFYQEVEAFLLEREAHHNLHFGILDTLLHNPGYYPTFDLWRVTSAGRLVAVALRTPPHNLLLSEMDVSTARWLAETLEGEFPGVLGGEGVARAFAERYAERHGRRAVLKMAQRIYQLSEVTPPRGMPGRFRRASEGDRALARTWFAAFQLEALGKDDTANATRIADAYLDSPTRSLYVWEDAGKPVSMAGSGGTTPNGVRIGAVYTPPEERGKGYASACVAALSQQLIEQGHRFCFLYTDLANPTSNSIYQRLGYHPVTDALEYRFER
jgi:predicted GNAT family acetyltransferase